MNRILNVFSLLPACLLLALAAAPPAPAAAWHAPRPALVAPIATAAAKLTPRNFTETFSSSGTLTIAFTLTNTGGAEAASPKITQAALTTTTGQTLGSRLTPATLPFTAASLPAGGSEPLSLTYSGVTPGQRAKFSLAFSAGPGVSASTGFYFTVPAAVLAAPSNLTATHGNGIVHLTWTPPAGTVSSYNVKRATTPGGPYTTVSAPGTVTGTSYSDTSVTNGTTYYYVVTAVSPGGESGNSNEAKVLAGFTGTDLSAAPGDGSITLTYDAIIGATNYQVFYSTDGTNFYGLGYAGNVTTFTQTGLTNGQTYYYYVVPYGDSGTGGASATVSATVSLPAPTSITAAPGDGQVTIKWKASAYPFASNYQVFYSSDGVNFYGLGYAGNVTKFTQTGLANRTKYYYYVVAYNSGGASPNSKTVSATPDLPAPANLKTASGNGSVTITWNAVASATNYQVFYSPDGVNFYGLGYAGDVTTFTQTGLANGQTYSYYIVAYNAGGSSLPSATVTATVSLPAPTNVSVTAGDGSATITWTASAFPGASNYQVFYSTDGTNFYGLGYTGNVTTFTQTGLANATKYYYYVVAYNDGGASPNSLTVSTTVTLAAPTGVAASPGDGQITITWDAVAAATNYQVFYSPDGSNFYGLGYTGDTTTFLQTGLANGQTYSYYVVAYNAGGASPNSDKASATVSLPAPTSVKATGGSNSVTITWKASAYPFAGNYQVFYSTDGVNFYGLGYAGNVTSFTQGGLSSGTTYYYYVVPYNNGGAGTTSGIVHAAAL